MNQLANHMSISLIIQITVFSNSNKEKLNNKTKKKTMVGRIHATDGGLERRHQKKHNDKMPTH